MWKRTTVKDQTCVVALHSSLPLGMQVSVEQTSAVSAQEATCIARVSVNIKLIYLLTAFIQTRDCAVSPIKTELYIGLHTHQPIFTTFNSLNCPTTSLTCNSSNQPSSSPWPLPPPTSLLRPLHLSAYHSSASSRAPTIPTAAATSVLIR